MKRLAPLFLLVFTATPLLPAEDAVELRYKFGADESRIYRTTTSLVQKQTVNEQEVKTTVNNASVDVRTLEKVDEKGQLHVQTENKRLSIGIEIGPLGKYEFDSTKADNEKGSTLGGTLTPLYERLSGAYLWTTITPTGEVVATRGYGELVKDALKDNPLAAQFAAGGTDDGHKSAVAQLYPGLPEAKVEVGDEWEGKFEMALPKIGKFDGKTVSKLEKVVTENGRTIAEVSVRTELGFDLDLEQNGAKVTGRLSTSKSDGKFRFDVAAGKILSREDSYTITGTMNVAVAGMNLTIPMEQVQTVKIELLEALPE